LADIFISYARADRERVEKLATALEGQGYSVWWDRHIAGGAEFSKDIEKELNAAKAVIVAWSGEANESRWVKDEAGLAAEAGKLVTLSLDGAEPPIGFKQFHAVNFQKADDTAFGEVVRSVATKLAGPGSEQPANASTKNTEPSSNRRVRMLSISAAITVLAALAGWLGFESLQQPSDPAIHSIAGDPDAAAGETNENYDSIAVLAFTDLSPQQDQEYFSDGIAEELLNVLARETDLRVAARTSSFAFKGKEESIAAIGEALNVEAVLEGSVRKAGDKVRITAQLIDARSGFHLWSDTYDRELSDIFAVQDEIASAIVRSLPSMDPREEVAAVAQTNSEAYVLYLQGRHQLTRRSRASIEAAKVLFEQSLAIDPDYAPAWADLSMSALLLFGGRGTYGDLSFGEVTVIAEPAIEKALALDPTLADGHSARGLLRGHQGDGVGAIAGYRKALELNPNVANARHLLYLALVDQGDFIEAFEVIDRAVELDPLSAIVLENHVGSLSMRGRFDDAVAAAERLDNLYPDWHHAKAALSRAHAATGDLAQSVLLILRASKLSGADNLDSEVAFDLIGLKLFDHPFLEAAPAEPASFLGVAEGRDEEARSLALEYFHANPGNPVALWRAVWTLWATGEDDAALKLAEGFISRHQTGTGLSWAGRPANCYPGLYVAGLWQRIGDREKAEPILTACRRALDDAAAQGVVLPYYERDMSVELLVLEGRFDEALTELRALADSGRFYSWWIGFEPIYAPLYDDPRFQGIVADLNARVDEARTKFLATAEDRNQREE